MFPTKSKCVLHIDHNLTAQCAVCNMLVECPCFKRFKVISTVRILEMTALEASQTWLRLSSTAPHPARGQFSRLFSFFSVFAHWKWRGSVWFQPNRQQLITEAPVSCLLWLLPPDPLATAHPISFWASLFTCSFPPFFLYLHLMLVSKGMGLSIPGPISIMQRIPSQSQGLHMHSVRRTVREWRTGELR